VKNHFYSKLRKFIRKILKILFKENVFEENNIDAGQYTAEKIYKIIKRQNISYDSLCKETIVDLIIKHNIQNKNDKDTSKLDKTSNSLSKYLINLRY
jgi:hypothetical protein